MKILFVVSLVCRYICTSIYLPATLAASSSTSTSDFTAPFVDQGFVGFIVFTLTPNEKM